MTEGLEVTVTLTPMTTEREGRERELGALRIRIPRVPPGNWLTIIHDVLSAIHAEIEDRDIEVALVDVISCPKGFEHALGSALEDLFLAVCWFDTTTTRYVVAYTELDDLPIHGSYSEAANPTPTA